MDRYVRDRRIRSEHDTLVVKADVKTTLWTHIRRRAR
jgi:hypothetical protein